MPNFIPDLFPYCDISEETINTDYGVSRSEQEKFLHFEPEFGISQNTRRSRVFKATSGVL